MRVHVAAFTSGRCGICEEPLREDDEIVKVDDEWCHATCAEERGQEVER